MAKDLIYFSRSLIFIWKYVNVTQVGLTEKLGIKANTIFNYEKKVTTSDFRLLVKLCNFFLFSYQYDVEYFALSRRLGSAAGLVEKYPPEL